MKIIHTNDAPKAVGPYSQATVSGGLVFCSGQIGLDPKTDEFAGSTVEKQTEQAIKNLKAVLEAAGSSLEKTIKTTCYLKNIDDFVIFNEIYGKYFTQKPARATVEASALPKGALVEIDVVAEI